MCANFDSLLKLAVFFFILSFSAVMSAQSVPGGGAGKPGGTTRICAVCQSWEAKDRNLPHALEMLDRAAAQGADVVCLPEECVPTDGGPAASRRWRQSPKSPPLGR